MADIYRFLQDDLAGARLVYLLELSWGESVWRFATENTSVTIDGDTYEYVTGLDWAESHNSGFLPGKFDPDSRSINITLHAWPHIDVPLEASNGRHLGQAIAKLYIYSHKSGNRIFLLDGVVRRASFSFREAPTEFTIEERAWTDQQFPPKKFKVMSTTWPDRDPKTQNNWYPVVFGSPGYVGHDDRGTPAMFVDTVNSYVLVSGYHVDATTVRILDRTDGTKSGYFTVVNGYDNLGQPVSYVDMSVGPPTAGDELWCQWEDAAGTRQYGVDNDSPVKTFGDALRWMSHYSTVRVDRSSLEAAAIYLAGYQIDTYISVKDERISPWDWILENIMDPLPLGLSWGPGGLTFVLWFPDRGVPDIRQELIEGENCWRSSAVDYTDRDGLVTTIRVSYWQDGADSEYLEEMVLSGDPERLSSTDAAPSPFLIQGYERYGVAPEDLNIQVPQTRDGATAMRIAVWNARRKSMQRLVISYQVQQEVGWGLSPGDMVRITDADIHIDELPALIVSQIWDVSGHIEITVEVPLHSLATPA